MGGPGSSRWGHYRGRTPVNTVPSLSLSEILINGAPASGKLEWRRGVLQTLVAAANYCVRETWEEGEREIIVSPAGGIDQRVRIARSHTGHPYFICPYCQEMPDAVSRRRKLYLVDNLVGCIRCHRLDYLSHLQGNYKRRKEAAPRARNRRGAGLLLDRDTSPPTRSAPGRNTPQAQQEPPGSARPR